MITVKVQEAGIVYLAGAVNKAGGFRLKSREQLTVLQLLAMGEGLNGTAAKGSSVIIRTNAEGEREKIPVDLGKILKGKQPDMPLQAQDILFVPNSAAKAVMKGSVDALMRIITVRTVIF